MKKSAKYYKDNPKSYNKKKAYDKKYNKENVANRVRANKDNRKMGTYGNGDGLDVCHKGKIKTKMKVRLCRASANRGDTNDTKGDKKARGKKS
jgi:hypothetical protein